MKIIDYINELKLELVKQDIIDTQFLDNRLLYQIINNQRALWLKNEINKGRSIEDNIRQTINGLELEVADASSFPLIQTTYRVLRTKLSIPRTIELLYSDTIMGVRSSNILGVYYNYVKRDKFVFSGNGKFNKKLPFCTLYDNYIYFKIPKANSKIGLITHISLEGVFENPIEVYNMTDKSLNPNYSGDRGTNDVFGEEYPISKAMWVYIKGSILQSELPLLTNVTQPNTQLNNELR